MIAHIRSREKEAPWLVPLEFPQRPLETPLSMHSMEDTFGSIIPLPSVQWACPGHPSQLWALLRFQCQDAGQVRTVGTKSAGTYSSAHQPRGSGHTTPTPGPSSALAGGPAASSGGARFHRTWGSPSGSSPGSPILPSPEQPTPQGTCFQR